MFICDVQNHYYFEDELIGGRLVIKEIKNNTVIKSSKPVDFSLDVLDALRIADVKIESSESKAVTVHLRDGLLYNPYGDAPSIDVSTALSSIGFREAEFYDSRLQVYAKELEPLLISFLQGRRLFVGGANIQLAPANILTHRLENQSYIAVAVSRRCKSEDIVKEVLKAFYYRCVEWGIYKDAVDDLRGRLNLEYGENIAEPDALEKQGLKKYTCVNCKKELHSAYVIQKCPDCFKPMTTKEGIVNLW